MTIQEAATILDQHQKWRKGADFLEQYAEKVIEALDFATDTLINFRQHIEQAYDFGVTDGAAEIDGFRPKFSSGSDYFTKNFNDENGNAGTH